MINRFRLKARSLQIGNVKLFSLLLLTFSLVFFALNLMPLFYESTLGVLAENNIPRYSELIDFIFAFLLCILVPVIYFSLSSSVERCFFIRASRPKGEPWDLFYYFSFGKMLSNLSFRIKLFFMKSAIAFVFLLPFFVCIIFLVFTVLKGVSLKACGAILLAAFVFFLNAVVFYKSFTAALFLCPYYFYKEDGISFGKAVRLSGKKMKKKKIILAKMKISFFGWFLLCILIFPIGYVWSYYRQSLAVAADSFMNS